MGSVTVMGTRTMSTFIRIRAPGRALAAAAPVAAGGWAPAGAPVGGVADDGGLTWTLLRGSSWPLAPATTRASIARASRTERIGLGRVPKLRRLPCKFLRRLGS